MTFDPAQHLSAARKNGPQDYLAVKWRLVWFREDHPDGAIETECLRDTPESAAFKATVSIPGKGKATGHGDETIQDFRDFYTKAETKAIGRALAALGYGTQFVGNELDEGERIVDSPTPRRTPAPTPASNGTPAPTARQAVPLTENEFDQCIEYAWLLLENGVSFDHIKNYFNEYRPRMNEAQRIVARQQLTALETNVRERGAVTAPAAAPAAPPPSH
jgi:hypothetical protein